MADPLWTITHINDFAPVDWVIIGAASDGKRYIAPDEGYVRDMVDFCDMNEVALFFKGNLRILPWAAANWREEFPNDPSE
jgi:protein gp37